MVVINCQCFVFSLIANNATVNLCAFVTFDAGAGRMGCRNWTADSVQPPVKPQW